MTVSEVAAPRAGDSNEPQERRSLAGQRVRFEALVEIGESKSGAFEAESVDVSPSGMRLRTAYLPDVGEKLLCRFDGAAGELLVEGEVQWRSEEVRGGEFGLRFVGLDTPTVDALRGLCAPTNGTFQAAETEVAVEAGTRVRLHIDGLAAPMKARVRDVAEGGLEVGSNLEFLKIGRPLELEGADVGHRRPAFVEQVKVEIDGASRVPQLVVSLRYESTQSSQVTSSSEFLSDDAVSHEPVEGQQPPAEDRLAVLKEVGARAAGVTAGAARHVGPVLRRVGKRGKGAFEQVLARLRSKSPSREPVAVAARRATAPPPGGGLRSDGRRIIRSEDEASETRVEAPAAPRRRSWMLASATAAAVLVVGVGVARSFSGSDVTAAPVALRSSEGATSDAVAAPGASAPLQATVPLFGATTLSTTELVPPPAPGGAAALANAGPASPSSEAKEALPREWGQGEVENPNVLSIKMDGDPEGLKGTAGPNGFTLVIPNHRAAATVAALARRDERIDSLDVINGLQGAEITVQFKGKVPAYRATARGNVVELALGTDAAQADAEERVAESASSKHASRLTASTKQEPKGRPTKKSGTKSKKKH